MNFTVSAKKFKRIIEAAILIASKGTFAATQMVRFDWSANEMHILSTNLEEYFDGTLCQAVNNADDVPFNTCGVRYEMLKLICNVSGQDITVSIDEDYQITMSNGKKALTIQANAMNENDIIDTSMFTEDLTKCFTISNNELIDTLSKLDNFRSFTDTKPILKGFNFDCSEKWIVAIDGYHAAIKKLKIPFESDTIKFTVHSGVAVISKKYFDKNASTDVSCSKKCAEFRTNDIVYSSRLYDGEFHPIRQIIPTGWTSVFRFEADDILAICKDYAKYISDKAPSPIILCKQLNDNKFYIGLRTPHIKACTETTATTDDKSEILVGYKNKFAKDCFELFKGRSFEAKYSGELKPLVLEDEDYLALLLPVRMLADTTASEFIGMVDKSA